MPSSSADSLVRLVRSGSSEGIAALAAGLESGAVTLEDASGAFADLKGVTDDLAAIAYETFRDLEGAAAPAIALALGTAVGIRDIEQLERPHVEICWTGPDADGPLVTSNASAIQEMLQGCRETGEILLVGYSFTAPDGSFMEKVVDELCEASKRRANIQIVLHKDEEESNKKHLLEKWDVFARKPKVFTWQPTDAHAYTKLHAKCLVVDRLQALVTSANFTFHGLESNIELGLLVRNQPIATAIHERFDHLINAGVLVPWEDPK